MTRGGTAARVISVECRIFPCQKCIIAPTTISIREKDGKRERERERERERGGTGLSNFAGRETTKSAKKTNGERSPARRRVGGGMGERSNSGDRKCIVLDGGAARTHVRARARACVPHARAVARLHRVNSAKRSLQPMLVLWYDAPTRSP